MAFPPCTFPGQPHAGLQQSQYREAQPFWPPWIGGTPPAPTLPPVLVTPPVVTPPVFCAPPFVFAPPADVPPAPPLHRRHERAHVPCIQSAPHQPYWTACSQVSPFGGGASVHATLPPVPE